MALEDARKYFWEEEQRLKAVVSAFGYDEDNLF